MAELEVSNETVVVGHIRSRICACVAVVLSLCSFSQQSIAGRLPLSQPGERANLVTALARQSRSAKLNAEHWALVNSLPVRFHSNGCVHELMRLDDDGPVYYHTMNWEAAISTATDAVRDRAPYNLDGTGLTIGLWDGGLPRASHQEFQNKAGRIVLRDEPNLPSDCNHPTNVAGTIGASGVVPPAMGMAPSVTIDAYDWEDDLSEMAARAVSFPGEPNKIYVSNHSYGIVAGWERYLVADPCEQNRRAWRWYGTWEGANSVERRFGRYSGDATKYDEIAYRAPYYLIFVAAGNDRTDNPLVGDDVWHYTTDANDNVTWHRTTYGPDCPRGDGEVKAGYDTIGPGGVAKNVITVGAVEAAVDNGFRGVDWAGMTDFSSWGPADDGRIKPDVVAAGTSFVGIKTTGGATDASYVQVNGTSIACPNASGSAMLLIQYYSGLFPGQAMRASTLKALVLHTADDLGRPGPDYCFGWGLFNSEAAVTLIRAHAQHSNGAAIVEDYVAGPSDYKSCQVSCDGTRPLRVTLCWTDPNAPERKTLDDRTPCLMNDLDLRVVGPDGQSVYYPYVLDPLNPTADATTGDNKVDNVEQVYVAGPMPGVYTIQVTCKAVLSGTKQWYSLVCSSSRPTGRVWTEPFGTAEEDYATAVSTDAHGSVYVAGRTAGSLAGPHRGGEDAFLSKYDAAGNLEWTKQFGTLMDDAAGYVAADRLGHIYVGGETHGSLDGPNHGLSDGFVSRYDSEGNVVWVHQFGTSTDDFVTGISTDGLGNVFVASMDLSPEPLVSKYDASGNLMWTRQVPMQIGWAGLSITADSLGNVYVGGSIDRSPDGGRGSGDAFVGKYDTAGNLVWVRPFETGGGLLTGISADGLGNVYSAGELGDSLPGASSAPVFVNMHDTNGIVMWMRQFGTGEVDSIGGMCADHLGNVYMTGLTEHWVPIAYPQPLGPRKKLSPIDSFVVKYDAEGNLGWSRWLGPHGGNSYTNICADGLGNLYIAGDDHGDAFVSKFFDGTWMP